MTAKTKNGLRVLEMKLADLSPAPYNPRRISDEAASGLKASVARFGLVQPVIWNKRTKRVVGGHQRIEALRALGETWASVIEVDLPETEEKALNLTLNNPAIAGEFTEGLAGLLEELAAAMPMEEFKGLGLDDLEQFVPKSKVEVVEDEVPEPPKVPVTKVGDLWTLGRHRLLCGDSTRAGDVGRLLGEAVPFLMVTDPPYGVEYDPEWRAEAGINKNRKKMGAIANDYRVDWTPAWQLFSGDVAYIWHAGRHASAVQASIEIAGFEIRCQIIWAKDRFALSRGHYHWQHEPCWYAVRSGMAGNWSGDRSQSTLWVVKAREDSGHGHGAQKPVECMARPIRNHDTSEVFDPFLGSGTTLIAAEQLDRSCFGLEIEPAYCDVIVERWQNLTGGKATRESV